MHVASDTPKLRPHTNPLASQQNVSKEAVLCIPVQRPRDTRSLESAAAQETPLSGLVGQTDAASAPPNGQLGENVRRPAQWSDTLW